MQTLPQFLFYAARTVATAVWRAIPVVLLLAAFILLLALCEHGTELLNLLCS